MRPPSIKAKTTLHLQPACASAPLSEKNMLHWPKVVANLADKQAMRNVRSMP